MTLAEALAAASRRPTKARKAYPAGSQAGRAARAHGEALEAALERVHDAYRAAGIADVRKVPTPVQVMGPTRRDARGRTTFPATFAARASCDFEGILSDGRAVRIEAKHREGDRLRLADVQPQQVAALRWADDHGALALLVVRLGADAWAVPAWRLWTCAERSWTSRHLDGYAARLCGLDWHAASVYTVRQVGA